MLKPIAVDPARQHDVANREIGARRIARQDERIVLVAQKSGHAAAEPLVDRVPS